MILQLIILPLLVRWLILFTAGEVIKWRFERECSTNGYSKK
jgi:hypothetical protein